MAEVFLAVDEVLGTYSSGSNSFFWPLFLVVKILLMSPHVTTGRRESENQGKGSERSQRNPKERAERRSRRMMMVSLLNRDARLCPRQLYRLVRVQTQRERNLKLMLERKSIPVI